MVTYSDSGVDISLEERTVAAIAAQLKKTLELQDVITESGHFAALVRLGNKGLALSTDGVGSKILVAEMLQKYDTIGIDCIAMVVNDLICVGAEPIALVDYLAVEKPDPNIAQQIGSGLVKGAEEANIAIIGGETASLPEIVHNLDLAATGLGIVDLDRIITGEEIVSGDILIGIESNGIHSNGLSLARKIFFQDAHLTVHDSLPGYSDIKIGEEILRPTAIYVKPILELLKKDLKIKGLAHITGGGFMNLKRLKKGMGFIIRDLPPLQPIFKSIFSYDVELEEMYRVFNMGIGFVVIVDSDDAEEALNIIRKYHKAHIVGETSAEIKDKINIETFQGQLIEI